MKFKITTLVDNTVSAGRGLIGEHGLSFLIETRDRKILFDTGQGYALLHNADLLGVRLEDVDTVVLSHGHYDHTGGLEGLLKKNRHFSLYAHPDVFKEKFSKRSGTIHSIGIPIKRDVLEQQGIRLVLSPDPSLIAPGVRSTGFIPMETSYETLDDSFLSRQDDNLIRDELSDDQALILETVRGTAVVLGCAHRGPVNTLKHVFELTGDKPIYALLGGLHLMNTSKKKIDQVVESLLKIAPEKIIAGHCTGFDALLSLCRMMPDGVRMNHVGSVMEI